MVEIRLRHSNEGVPDLRILVRYVKPMLTEMLLFPTFFLGFSTHNAVLNLLLNGLFQIPSFCRNSTVHA